MITARVSELRNNLRRYLELVRAGGRVLILHRNRPVAEIIPVAPIRRSHETADENRLGELERLGLIRRGTGRIPGAGPGPGENRILESLLKERKCGR